MLNVRFLRFFASYEKLKQYQGFSIILKAGKFCSSRCNTQLVTNQTRQPETITSCRTFIQHQVELKTIRKWNATFRT